jgi:hypothetical protein
VDTVLLNNWGQINIAETAAAHAADPAMLI